jgi:DNA polymerase IV
MNMFCYESDEKKEKLDRAIDRIRNRYGSEAIQRATLIEHKPDKKK